MKKLLTYCLLSFTVAIGAQQDKPKVGLVLRGGGAKGYAHVGILKEIDKAGIKLDYIGGTSMGAIIGGLYATGYSANQIEVPIKKPILIRLFEISYQDIHLFDNILKGYAVGYSYDLFIGPIELKYSWSPQNREGFW